MSEFLTDAVAFLPVLARGLWTTVLLTVCALAVPTLAAVPAVPATSVNAARVNVRRAHPGG